MYKFVHYIAIIEEGKVMYYYFNLNEFPQITRFYSVTRNTVWEITERDNIVIYIQSGCCYISYENVEYQLNQGDMFFIPANHIYKRYPVDNLMCTMTYIHFSLSNEVEQLELHEMAKRISNSKEEIDNQILDGVHVLWNQSAIYLKNKYSLKNHRDSFRQLNDIRLISIRRQLMCGLQSSIILCGILSTLSQNTIEEVSTESYIGSSPKVPDNLKKAIRFIRDHYTEQISLDDLTSHCNVSKRQLIRYFKAAFDKTPITYVTEYKISRAKELLYKQPQLTIREISDELGFDNQHYFTRVFSKLTGETPSHYRYRTVHYKEYIKNQHALKP